MTPLAPPPRRKTLQPGPPKVRLDLSDFPLKHLLGSGSQGKVFLVTHKGPSNSLYAMKVIDKRFLGRRQDLALILQEQKVMKKMGDCCPFILHLKASFNDSSYFFLITVRL